MLRLAIPALAEEMLVLLVTWTDWYLAGHYLQNVGDATKAAMGTMAYVMWLVPCLFATVAIGATALIARRVGMQQVSKASTTANQAFSIGMILAAVMTLLLVLAGGAFISLMQLEGDAAKFAGQYLSVIAPAVPLLAISQVGAACLRGAGDTVTGFVIKIIVVTVNIIVSTLLVSGHGPPELANLKGIATGTACGYAVGGIVLLGVLIRGRAGLRLSFGEMLPQWSYIRELFRIGLPGGFDMGALILCQLIFLAIVNSLGKEAAAAHGLAVQIEACAFLPGVAFQVAAATLTGQYLGANMRDEAMKGAMTCWLSGFSIMAVAAIALWFSGDQIALFFTGDASDPTTARTGELLQLIAFAIPSLSVVMIITGAFRGAGDTMWPFLITVFGFVLIRIPLATFLSLDDLSLFGIEDVPLMGWGIIGAWYSMVVDLFVRSLIIGWRFFGGKWRNVRID
jgi:putative MATE family efflux protein